MGGMEAMAASKEIKFSLKVMIDKEKEKLLFAEVNSDFADTLISFLTLPLGTIVRLLKKHYGGEAPVIGSLNALYKSLEDLDPTTNFWTKEGKLMLLNPRNSSEAHLKKLRINIDDTEPIKYFICERWVCNWSKNSGNVSMYYNSTCACGSSRNRELIFRFGDENMISGGVFTKETASFIISDDLQLLPNLVGSGLHILKKLGIKGTFAIEERTLFVGFKEIMDLVKLAFISRTPLTDLIFQKGVQQTVPGNVISGPCTSSTGENSKASSKKMTLNVVVRKSSGKVILAQTREDFVDFLFSLLSIPLGRAFSLLGNDSSYASIHNLFTSVASLTGDVYGPKIQNTFELPPMYLSKHQLLPLTQQQIPNEFLDKNIPVSGKDPKGCQGSYVKGPTMFMVTDDLHVRPISTISAFSILNSLKIHVSDVEERVIEIGIDEALNILKASIFSTSVLNNCLRPLLQRQPKKETIA